MMLSLEVVPSDDAASGEPVIARDESAGEFAALDVVVSVELRLSVRNEELFAGETV
jgi:hypothetical protein